MVKNRCQKSLFNSEHSSLRGGAHLRNIGTCLVYWSTKHQDRDRNRVDGQSGSRHGACMCLHLSTPSVESQH